MSEQMFNIIPHFHAKLSLPLELYGQEAVIYCSAILYLWNMLLSLFPMSLVLRFFLFAVSAAVLVLTAGQCRLCRSSASFTDCRRVFANTVAAPMFAAAYCGAKFAIQRRVSCLPPCSSATMWRIFAKLANRLLSRPLMK
jgi:hypothetical protein